MIGDLRKLNKFEEIDDGGIVNFGSDVPYSVKGKGSFMLNDKIRCDDAYWVQGLKYDLLSVSQLNKLGHKMKFKKRKVKIFDDEGNLIGTKI